VIPLTDRVLPGTRIAKRARVVTSTSSGTEAPCFRSRNVQRAAFRAFAPDEDLGQGKRTNSISAGGCGRPEEHGGVVPFLASACASYTRGAPSASMAA
jgi:hypothetical protein